MYENEREVPCEATAKTKLHMQAICRAIMRRKDPTHFLKVIESCQIPVKPTPYLKAMDYISRRWGRADYLSVKHDRRRPGRFSYHIVFELHTDRRTLAKISCYVSRSGKLRSMRCWYVIKRVEV